MILHLLRSLQKYFCGQFSSSMVTSGHCSDRDPRFRLQVKLGRYAATPNGGEHLRNSGHE
jgi:hypothetical protein